MICISNYECGVRGMLVKNFAVLMAQTKEKDFGDLIFAICACTSVCERKALVSVKICRLMCEN